MKLKWQGKGEIPKSIKISRAFSDRVKVAVENCTPVDTGRMKASYIITSKANRITISNNAKNPKSGFPYPIVVEFGSVKMKPRYPIQKGIKLVIDRIPSNTFVEIGDLNSSKPVSQSIFDKYYSSGK
jgi:hypothetical protein